MAEKNSPRNGPFAQARFRTEVLEIPRDNQRVLRALVLREGLGMRAICTIVVDCLEDGAAVRETAELLLLHAHAPKEWRIPLEDHLRYVTVPVQAEDDCIFQEGWGSSSRGGRISQPVFDLARGCTCDTCDLPSWRDALALRTSTVGDLGLDTRFVLAVRLDHFASSSVLTEYQERTSLALAQGAALVDVRRRENTGVEIHYVVSLRSTFQEIHRRHDEPACIAWGELLRESLDLPERTESIAERIQELWSTYLIGHINGFSS